MTRSCFRILVFFSVFLSTCSQGYGQSDSAGVLTCGSFNRKIERDTSLLVTHLIAGLTDDEAKYAAIHCWIGSHIYYDYHKQFSLRAYRSPKTPQRVLRRRKATAKEFAELTNTMCRLAGIPCVSVEGYVKNQLSDVNDSLFFSNHTWNAVYIHNRWYLSDLSKSSGYFVMRWSDFSRRVFTLQKSIWDTHSKMRVIRSTFIQKGNKMCDIPDQKFTSSHTVYKLPFFWRLVNGVLRLMPMRTKMDHGETDNLSFYKTNPELLAITHFPNVAYWSLTGSDRNAQTYTADSSYFFLTKEPYLAQQREGRPCLDCDRLNDLSFVGKRFEIIRQSTASTPRNTLLPARTYSELAHYYYLEGEKATDSLHKIQLYDSAIYCMNQARSLLNQSKSNNAAFQRFHLFKARQKYKETLTANRIHTKRNEQNVRITQKRAILFRRLPGRNKLIARNYSRHISRIKHLEPATKSERKIPENSKLKLQLQYQQLQTTVDSLNRQIDSLQQRYAEKLQYVSQRIWDQTALLRPQIRYFSYSGYLRMEYALDSRDKIMMDIQDSLAIYEHLHQNRILRTVILPSDTVFKLYNTLHAAVKLRNRTQIKLLSTHTRLYGGTPEYAQTIRALRTREADRAQHDYCFIDSHKFALEEFERGFRIFFKAHRDLFYSISWDNYAEKRRNRNALRTIYKTGKYHNGIIQLHQSELVRLRTHVLKSKKTYLDALKKAAVAERTAS